MRLHRASARTLCALLLLAVGSRASAASGASGEPPAAPAERPPLLGAQLDVGFPDGLAASLVYRPVWPLRIDAGGSWNVLGFGVRGGVTLAPFRWSVAPVLRAEVGHEFESDASGLVEHFATLTPTERTLLRRASYDYVSAQLGVDFGASDRLVLFVRAGFTWFWATTKDFQAAVQAANPGVVVEAQDPTVRGTAPSVALGVLYYFW